MRTRITSLGRLSAILTFLLFAIASCKKDDPKKSMADCRFSNTGVDGTNGRDLVFWARQDFNCGNPQFVEVRNTEQGSPYYIQLYNNYITQYYSAQPACDAIGAIRVRVPYGHDYQYTIACTGGRQWTGKVTVDCNSADCVFVELK